MYKYPVPRTKKELTIKASIQIEKVGDEKIDAGDTYTDKVGLLYVDAHYQVDSFGSQEEYIK